MRFLAIFLFYLNQGIGLSLFGFAIPAWLTANGASLEDIATVVSASALPWSLKFISGALVDRYTFLPMGRRRLWIIGAQSLLALSLVCIAILTPSAEEILLLAVIGFVLNMAVISQDVGVDALAIDLFGDDERPFAAGVMFGAQTLGGAMAVALSGLLLDAYGFSTMAFALAVIPATTIAFGIMVREREGERRLPWSDGETHRANLGLQATKWRDILGAAFRAIVLPASLMAMPLLLVRAIPGGVAGTYGPTLFTENAQWSMAQFTNFVALVGVALALYTVLFAGRVTQALGERKAFLIAVGGASAAACGFASIPSLWTETGILIAFVIVTELLAITALLALIPICMRLCSPAAAGTQFVIYMGVANLGSPIGAYLTTVTAGAGHEELLFWALGVVFAAAFLWALWAKPLFIDNTPLRQVARM